MLVKDYMNSAISTINPDALLSEAERIMKNSRLHRLVVMTDGKIKGVLTRYTARQIRRHDRMSGINDQQVSFSDVLRVKDVMQRNVTTISPEASIDRLTVMAQDSGSEAFVILENGQPVGVITILDILGLIIDDFGFIGQREKPVLYITSTADSLPGIIHNINRCGAQILSIVHLESSDGENRFTVYLDTESAEEVVDMLMSQKPPRCRTTDDLAKVESR